MFLLLSFLYSLSVSIHSDLCIFSLRGGSSVLFQNCFSKRFERDSHVVSTHFISHSSFTPYFAPEYSTQGSRRQTSPNQLYFYSSLGDSNDSNSSFSIPVTLIHRHCSPFSISSGGFDILVHRSFAQSVWVTLIEEGCRAVCSCHF